MEKGEETSDKHGNLQRYGRPGDSEADCQDHSSATDGACHTSGVLECAALNDQDYVGMAECLGRSCHCNGAHAKGPDDDIALAPPQQLTGGTDDECPAAQRQILRDTDDSYDTSRDDDDDETDDSFYDDLHFIDSGWGDKCLQVTEDIDFEFVYALHTFVATVEGQANATKGDTMVLLDDSNSYWWLVRVVKDSSIGKLRPGSYESLPTDTNVRTQATSQLSTSRRLQKGLRA